MERAAPLPTTGRKAAALAVLLLAAACARNSPALPPDLSHLPPDQRYLAADADTPEAKMDCAALKEEGVRNRAAVQQYEGVIVSNRGHNQAVAYAGGILPPLLLASRNDEEAKKALDQLQAKADRIDRLTKAKRCSAGA
jgi:hypothetical protein